MEFKYECYENLNEGDMFQYIECCDDNVDICVICHLDEMEDNNNKLWTKYNFKCCHSMHSRCARRWFSYKNKLNCPFCGDIKLIKGIM